MSAILERVLQEEGVTFPVRYCLKCHKEVIVHARLGAGVRVGDLVWHCLFCDEETLTDDEGHREQNLHDLRELGYTVVDPEELESSGGGCGTGGGCGSGGGCSS